MFRFSHLFSVKAVQ